MHEHLTPGTTWVVPVCWAVTLNVCEFIGMCKINEKEKRGEYGCTLLWLHLRIKQLF